MSSPEIMIRVTADTAQAQRELSSVADTAKGMGDKIESGNQRATRSYSDLATKVTAVTGTALALYDAYDRVEDASLRVERAQLQVKRAQEGVEDKQRKLNEVIAKYGENSEQAREALNELSIAQDRLQLTQKMLQEAQEDMNRTYISAATTSIPMLIMALDKLKGAYTTLGSVLTGLSGKLSGLGLGTGLGGVAVGAAALLGTGAAGGELFEQFRKTLGLGEWWSPYSMTGGWAQGLLGPMGQVSSRLSDLMRVFRDWDKEWAKLKDWGKAFEDFAKTAGDSFKKILDEAKSKFGDIKKAIEDKWKEITDAVDDKLIKPLKSAFGKIKDAFESGIKSLPDVAKNVFQQVVQAIQSALNTALASIQKFAGEAASALSRVSQNISQAAWSAAGQGQPGGWPTGPGGFQFQGGYAGYRTPYGFIPVSPQTYYEKGWNWSYNPPGAMYFQQGAVFTRPTRLRDVVVAEREPEVLLPASRLRGMGGGHVFNFTLYVNEVVDAKDPAWKRELAREIMSQAYEVMRRGTAL